MNRNNGRFPDAEKEKEKHDGEGTIGCRTRENTVIGKIQCSRKGIGQYDGRHSSGESKSACG